MDMSFLDAQMPRLTRRRQPLNFYDLFGLGGSEQAADQTLAYFLDPDERHGMRTRFVDSLLRTLDGAPTVDRSGLRDVAFDAEAHVGASGWRVDRQVSVDPVAEPLTELSWPGIMDIYLTNEDLDLAIVIENKVGAALHNPLESYVGHAVGENYQTVMLAVLAPYPYGIHGDEARWVSRAITYPGLFERISEIEHADTSDVNVRRSVELLRQFREIRERSPLVTDYTREAAFLNEFRDWLVEREQALREFFDTRDQANKMCRARSKSLEPLIKERFERVALRTGWESTGAATTGGWTTTWNAYELTEPHISVELILTPDPKRSGPITAKAYPGRTYKLYPDADHVPIGVQWGDADEDIADAFIAFALRVAEAHPSGA